MSDSHRTAVTLNPIFDKFIDAQIISADIDFSIVLECRLKDDDSLKAGITFYSECCFVEPSSEQVRTAEKQFIPISDQPASLFNSLVGHRLASVTIASVQEPNLVLNFDNGKTLMISGFEEHGEAWSLWFNDADGSESMALSSRVDGELSLMQTGEDG